MSGHSKWSTIKRQKGKTDAARAKVFTKIGRDIVVAVKVGGADPSSNPRLRESIAKARAANMPNDIITRNIKRAVGDVDTVNYESIVYEGYGINGVAVIVEALTDNRNRTGGEIRHIFDKYGGGLGATGCVSYRFETKGVLRIDKSTISQTEDDFVLSVLEYPILDIVVEDEEFVIYTNPNDFTVVRESLASIGVNFVSAQLDRIPNITVQLDSDSIQKFETMLDKFEENDDVQEVYYNIE
ncbi:MAG: YebC/PmpR family DNA-binding transcriptional regulator [Firmicutes bacterium]|nr:YebC/PmpR family DNA-binding transcriptional regulator [Bacillota bacterium]